ncbi:hypothetical protein ACQP60_18920 [Isoptericola variabilis]|uniref:hypothetical protein n=1 Tax=Isoptericola variabilis TaxID=139208 RepID=UPI003D21C1EF
MAIDNFIPEIWAADMLTSFREQTVAASLANRNYEGDASKGNTVHITSAVDVSIFDYSIGEGNGGTTAAPKPRTTQPEATSDTGQELLIDQEKNFDFYVDDIDRRQAAGTMDAYTQSAAEGLAEDADKFILATAATGAGIGLSGAAPTTGDAAFNIIRDLRKSMNQAKVPKTQRVLLCNSEFDALLVDAGSKITSVDTSGSPAGLRDAVVGRILGFETYTSENLPVIDEPFALAFYRPALAYVNQIEKTEAMRANDRIADRLRGLHVYGAKVIRPLGVAKWSVTP